MTMPDPQTVNEGGLAAALDRFATATERLVRQQELTRSDARDADPVRQAEHAALRRPLRKLPFGSWVRGVPGLGAIFETKVPVRFWATSEGRIDVCCPCGATPHPDAWPEPCTGAEHHSCPRWYLFDGRDVRVAFSPKGGAPTPEEEIAEQ